MTGPPAGESANTWGCLSSNSRAMGPRGAALLGTGPPVSRRGGRIRPVWGAPGGRNRPLGPGRTAGAYWVRGGSTAAREGPRASFLR